MHIGPMPYRPRSRIERLLRAAVRAARLLGSSVLVAAFFLGLIFFFHLIEVIRRYP